MMSLHNTPHSPALVKALASAVVASATYDNNGVDVTRCVHCDCVISSEPHKEDCVFLTADAVLAGRYPLRPRAASLEITPESREIASRIICEYFGLKADINWHMGLVKALVASPDFIASLTTSDSMADDEICPVCHGISVTERVAEEEAAFAAGQKHGPGV